MKWILWCIWGIFCFVYLLIASVMYLCTNIIAILWDFKISNVIPWGNLFYGTDIVRNLEREFEQVEYPDKNPWETYKRWVFFLKE